MNPLLLFTQPKFYSPSGVYIDFFDWPSFDVERQKLNRISEIPWPAGEKDYIRLKIYYTQILQRYTKQQNFYVRDLVFYIYELVWFNFIAYQPKYVI